MSSELRPLSSSSPRVKQLRRLARSNRERDEQRALLAEGPTLLAAALDGGTEVREVYIDGGRASDPTIAGLLARLPAGPKCWVVPAGTLDRVGDVVSSQGVVAVLERRDVTLPPSGRSGFVFVLADVADPGNVGTTIRAAVAAGADAVVVGGGADPTSPKVLRASAGACFAVPVVRTADAATALDAVGEAGFRLVGATVSGGRDHDAVDLTGPVAIVVGNEARGLSEGHIAALDDRVTIAMAGPAESLNVAMAATILAFEVLRQRRSR